MGDMETFRTHSGTWCQVSGEGPPVILIHGVGLDHEMWFAQREALSEHFKVITFDLLNHGESPSITGEATLYHFSGQLDRLFGELKLDKASIVGFSFGVPIAQFFALNHGDMINKLAFLSGVYSRTEEEIAPVAGRYAEARAKGTSVLVNGALERWFSKEYQELHPHVITMVRRRLERNNADAFLAAYNVFITHDPLVAGRLDGVRKPTLVMTGELDPGSTPALSERMVADLPDGRLHILEGQRHMAPVEAADEVNGLLLEFLRG
jgi:pimeloyl-ACP methyl ester carboxylesterase